MENNKNLDPVQHPVDAQKTDKTVKPVSNTEANHKAVTDTPEGKTVAAKPLDEKGQSPSSKPTNTTAPAVSSVSSTIINEVIPSMIVVHPLIQQIPVGPNSSPSPNAGSTDQLTSSILTVAQFAAMALGPVGDVAAGVISAVEGILGNNSAQITQQLQTMTTTIGQMITDNTVQNNLATVVGSYNDYLNQMATVQAESTENGVSKSEYTAAYNSFMAEFTTGITDTSSPIATAMSQLQGVGLQGFLAYISAAADHIMLYQKYLSIQSALNNSVIPTTDLMGFLGNALKPYIINSVNIINPIVQNINNIIERAFNPAVNFGEIPTPPYSQLSTYLDPADAQTVTMQYAFAGGVWVELSTNFINTPTSLLNIQYTIAQWYSIFDTLNSKLSSPMVGATGGNYSVDEASVAWGKYWYGESEAWNSTFVPGNLS